MSTSFQEFKIFCNKTGLDFQWVNIQSPKSVPEDNPSESPPAINHLVQEKVRPATEPLKTEVSRESVSNILNDFKNASLWSVFKKNSRADSSTVARSGVSSRHVSENTPGTKTNEPMSLNQENITIINGLPQKSSVMRQENDTAVTTSYSLNIPCNLISSHNGDMLPHSPMQGNNAPVSSATDSMSYNNESVPSLASSVSTSSSVYSPWDPPHPPSLQSLPNGISTSLDPEVSCLKCCRTNNYRPRKTNVQSNACSPTNVSILPKRASRPGSEGNTASPPTARNQDISCDTYSAAAFTEPDSTVVTAVPSYMQRYLDKPQNWFESTMGKYCPLFLRGTKNIDYDSSEFKFERKMIAVQYLLLDERSEPRRFYNPVNKSVSFWKRLFNFDTMPSYDQLLDEAEHHFNSYQYRYAGFQRIEPYSVFCPWKNAQREIDLVLDHIHFSLDIGKKRSMNRRGNITFDTLDSTVGRDVHIKPYQYFTSNNLVYEGLSHPAEQSSIISPDTSLIERAYQELVKICKVPTSSFNDFPGRNHNSAPQLTVPKPSRPCRLLLVRESRTATESEVNKNYWRYPKRKHTEVIVPTPPRRSETASLFQKWFFLLVRP